ncbi:OmpA family protein [uncultured Eudoraea sp.]|uniref:OmpA family protein n=1 Tax=uncultured Eudoraea sp. TaxID=1035614 RepID=UPI002627D66C|nr:OmpA family protein [uncultured Eudoraea sp.]
MVSKFTYSSLLTCFWGISSLLAQNLIHNPSFEEFEACPERLGNFENDVILWTTPTEGSTDYFNGCSTIMGTPENFNGTQPADFGNGYAGLYLYAPNDYREYIQASLRQTLEKGKTYQVSFYVSLAERSDFAVKDFGVLFSSDKLNLQIKKELSRMQRYKIAGNNYNFMEIGYTNFYKDTRDWVLVSTRFEAKGTENYMIIGNFKHNAGTRKFKTKKGAKQGAYYYVDMVALKPVQSQDSEKKSPSGAEVVVENYELDKIHVFKNVLFNFDEFELLDSAKADVRRIYDYLVDNESLRIKVDGHTDNIGTESYNQELSDRRSFAVAQYLIDLGLSKDRISWKGHGGLSPIASNDNEEGRQQNRRVAFVISKMEEF